MRKGPLVFGAIVSCAFGLALMLGGLRVLKVFTAPWWLTWLAVILLLEVSEQVARFTAVLTMLFRSERPPLREALSRAGASVGEYNRGRIDFWQRSLSLKRLPHLWELFSFLLPGKVRREAFEPAYNDMLEDYVRMRKFRGKWARRWLAFAFTVRTLFMVVDCLRVMLQSGAGKILLNFLPDTLRNWWRRQ